MAYGIQIRTGARGDYGIKLGWDMGFATRAAAEACAAHARRNEGWEARVIDLTPAFRVGDRARIADGNPRAGTVFVITEIVKNAYETWLYGDVVPMRAGACEWAS